MKWLNSECRSNWVRYNQIQLLPSVNGPSTSDESSRNGSPSTNALRFVNNYRTIFWFTDVYTFFLLFQWLFWGFTDATSFLNQSWKCFQSGLYYGRCRIQWNGLIPTNSQYFNLIDYVFKSNQVLFIVQKQEIQEHDTIGSSYSGIVSPEPSAYSDSSLSDVANKRRTNYSVFWITNGLSLYFYSL